MAGLDGQQPTSPTTSDSGKSKTGVKTPVVIPVKRVGADDKKTSVTTGSKDAASSEPATAAAAGDTKPVRKLFSVSRRRNSSLSASVYSLPV